MTASRTPYYGWRVIAALFIVGMMIYGGGLYGFTVFVPELTREFGWSRAVTGGLVSVFWFTAPFTLLAGYLNERVGSYRLILAGIVLAAVAMMTLSIAHTMLLMFVLRALMGVAKIFMASAVNVMAAAWFRRRFGLAIALCYSGWHFGGLTLAPLTQALIDRSGWRTTAVTMGILIGLVSLPLVIAWARVPSPETLGLQLDGAREQSPGEAQNLLHAAAGSPLTRAMFWLAVVATVLGGLAYGGLLAHEVSLISDHALQRPFAAIALGVTAGCAILGAVNFGQLIDRWPYRTAMLAELFLMLMGVGGFLLYLHQPSTLLMFISAVLFGISIGGFDTCVVSHLRKHTDTSAFTKVYGRWYFFYLVALFSGPILTGAVYDAAGSYRVALMLMMLLIGGAMLAVLASPKASAFARPLAAH